MFVQLNQIFPVLCLLFLSHDGDAGYIDLSHKLGPDTYSPVFVPDLSPYQRVNVTTIRKNGTFTDYSMLSTGEHAGTHVDVPSHYYEGYPSAADLKLEWTIAEGVAIDVTQESAADRGFILTPQKLQEWEVKHGRIPQNAAVLVNFGWGKKFDNFQDYCGTEDITNGTSFVFPIIGAEAGKWLLHERDAKILGVDVHSLDLPSSDSPNHKLFLGQNRTLVENMKFPDNMPARGFRFHATPPPFVGATGSPVRAFAVTYDDDRNHACALKMNVVYILCIFIATYVIL